MADGKLKVLTICGSLRKKSYNACADARAARAGAGRHDASRTRRRGKPSRSTTPTSRKLGFPEAVENFAVAVRAADGIIIVTPEYNWSIPGGLKNALDWVSRMKEQPFKDKPVAIQSASQGPLGGGRMQYHLRMAMTYLNAFVFGTPEIFVGMAQNKFDKDTSKLTDEATRKIVGQQLEGFAKFIERVRA